MKNLIDDLDKIQNGIVNDEFTFGMVCGALMTMFLLIASHAAAKRKKGGNNDTM